jgi:hypothetical protein
VPVVLAGRGGAAGWPKKSNPRSESFVLVALGGAGPDFAGTCIAGGPVLLALCAGAGSAPIRSTCGAAVWPTDALRMDSLCATFCLSLTTPNGTSSSPSASSVEGSGMGPSITHLFSSYLVRIKFSILASDGTWLAASFASQYLFARPFPQFKTLCSCSSVQASRSTDLTRLIWVPIPRWMPEQRMQTKTPRFQLDHLVSEHQRNQRATQVKVQRRLERRETHVCCACNRRTPCWALISGDS